MYFMENIFIGFHNKSISIHYFHNLKIIITLACVMSIDEYIFILGIGYTLVMRVWDHKFNHFES